MRVKKVVDVWGYEQFSSSVFKIRKSSSFCCHLPNQEASREVFELRQRKLLFNSSRYNPNSHIISNTGYLTPRIVINKRHLRWM